MTRGTSTSDGTGMVTWKTFKITVKALEDLHPGSGLGGAGVDALVARDARGRPVIRWSHFKGVLKEAYLERAEALGTGKERMADELEQLFGVAYGDQRGVLVGTGLHGDVSNAHVGASLSLTKGSTARERGKRTPQDDTLRQVEFIRAGSTLAGYVQVQGHGSAAAWFQKLARRVDRLGGQRGRGSGRVQLGVVECQGTAGILPLGHRAAVGIEEGDGLTVLVRMLAPVCLSSTPVPWSLISSHSHVPPRAMSGALVAALLAADQGESAQAIAEGQVVVGPGYPIGECEGEGAYDALPIPLNYLSMKPAGQPGLLPWWVPKARGEATQAFEERWPGDHAAARGPKLKRPSPDAYLYGQGSSAWQALVATPTPTQRNDVGLAQRRSQELNLYAVEELPEDTVFVTHLAGSKRELQAMHDQLATLRDSGRWLRLGHGGAPCQILKLQRRPAREPEDGLDGQVRLMLESDLILRSRGLHFHPRLSLDAVKLLLKEAGCSETVRQRLDRVEDVSETQVIRGWNAQSRRPRIPVLAIRRGSVARLVFKDPQSALDARACLSARGLAGLGERTDEGYGRLRVEQPVASTIRLAQQPQAPATQLPSTEQLLRRADRLIASLKKTCSTTSVSRWQRLRDLAQLSDRAQRGQRWKAWLDAGEGKQSQGGTTWLGELGKLLDSDEGAKVAYLVASRLARAGLRAERESGAEAQEAVDAGQGGGA